MSIPTPNDLLKTLIRFDTTNPPGNEVDCVLYIRDLLASVGIETTLIAKDPQRPNLIARVKGDGSAPPLLLQGHVDVVTTENQEWTYPPFDAVEADGFIWGRGTLDMKGAVAMYISTLLRLKTENIATPGDIVLCVLSDEEQSSNDGAKFLVEEHAEQFAGIKHCLGEAGATSTWMAGKKFYPIQVAEKLVCRLRMTVNGGAGHGAFPMPGGTLALLGKLLTTLDTKQPPVHITPVAKQMFSAIADEVGFPTSMVLRGLLNPALTDRLLGLLGDQRRTLNPMLRSTVSPTIIRASDKINVIPETASVDLDGRLLPGVDPADFVAQLQQIVGPDVLIEIVQTEPPGKMTPDMSQFALLADVMRELDPTGTSIPYMLPAVSDARYFERIGIQNYGFTPMDLPKDFNFAALAHAADERIPVDALAFGIEGVLKVCERYVG